MGRARAGQSRRGRARGLRRTFRARTTSTSGSANGAAALDLLLAAQTAPPDVILLDMNMPLMDGRAFAAAYRRLAPPHAPIVVITAAGNAADRARQLAAAGFLGKPFALDDLCACVVQHGRRAA